MELGIKGHKTRGDEVVKILETLGGNNCYNLTGIYDNKFYYIRKKFKNITNSYIGPDEIKGYKIFSLEKFLEKFPYKVGDKVNVWTTEGWSGRADIETSKITSMRWNSDRNEVAYRLKDIIGEFYTDDMGKVNDEKNLFHTTNEYEEIVENSFQGGYEKCKSDIKLNGYDLPEGYHFTDENGNVISATKILIKKNSPTYPKTYKECCDVLGIGTMDNDAEGYKYLLLIQFQELIIARDAYWKIAGDYLELDKPWEPDWNWCEYKFCIGTIHDEIEKFHAGNQNCILAFPTEEMRDEFHNNFKNLIEQCKELL